MRPYLPKGPVLGSYAFCNTLVLIKKLYDYKTFHTLNKYMYLHSKFSKTHFFSILPQKTKTTLKNNNKPTNTQDGENKEGKKSRKRKYIQSIK